MDWGQLATVAGFFSVAIIALARVFYSMTRDRITKLEGIVSRQEEKLDIVHKDFQRLALKATEAWTALASLWKDRRCLADVESDEYIPTRHSSSTTQIVARRGDNE